MTAFQLGPSAKQYGAPNGIRTRDLILTMDALYQLSYRGKCPLLFNTDNCNRVTACMLHQISP